ncbi:MAG: hypothetical protein ACRBBQ_04215 [Cognatishimia sp.]
MRKLTAAFDEIGSRQRGTGSDPKPIGTGRETTVGLNAIPGISETRFSSSADNPAPALCLSGHGALFVVRGIGVSRLGRSKLSAEADIVAFRSAEENVRISRRFS